MRSDGIMSESKAHLMRKSVRKSTKKTFLKLLSMPSPARLLSSKQKKTLFLKAVYTVRNYMGRPTASCEVDRHGLYEYVGNLFRTDSDIRKDYLNDKAKALPSTSCRIYAGILKCELEENVKLGTRDTLFVRVFTNTNKYFDTTDKPASLSPRWNEFCELSVNEGDTDVIAQVWARQSNGDCYMIGRAVQDIQFIPCTGDSIWLFIDAIEKSRKILGYLKVRYAFKTDEPKIRLNTQFQHLLFCYLAFENLLHAADPKMVISVPVQAKALDVANHKIKLYRHALQNILPQEAISFLHQHIMQSGLTDYENVLCCWLVTNHYYLKTDRVQLSAVYALLQEVTLMEQCVQNFFENELKRSFLAEVDSSVEKCLEWLCNNLMAEIRTDAGRDILQQTIGFLMHVDTHYNEGTLQRATEVIKQRTVYMSKVLFELYANREHPVWSQTLTDTIISDVLDILEKLKIADELFMNSEWKVAYTTIVHHNLYKKVTSSVGFVIASLAEDAKCRNPENVTLLINVYTTLNCLLSYIEKYMPEIHNREFTKVEGCNLWIGPDLFESYLGLLESKHQVYLDTWLENCGNKPVPTDRDPVLRYVKDLLKEWEKLTWLDAVPPTFALLQVYRKKCSYLSKGIFERGKTRSWYCIGEPFYIKQPICNMLNRMQSLTDSVKMIADRTQDCWTMETTGILAIEVGKLYSDTDSLHDIYEILQQKIEQSIRYFMKSLTVSNARNTPILNELQSYLDNIRRSIRDNLDEVPKNRMKKSLTHLFEDLMLEISEGTRKYMGDVNSNAVEYFLEKVLDDMSDL